MFVFNAKCSVLDGRPIANLFLPRLRDHCRREGEKTVRVEAVDDYKKQCSPDVAGQLHIRTNSSYSSIHKTWASASQISAWRGGMGTEAHILDEQLLSAAPIGHLLQWKDTHPRVNEQHRLYLIGCKK